MVSRGEELAAIQAQVECPICFETFNQPKTLPCQHSYCLSCIVRLEANNNQRGRIKCPECNAVHIVPPAGFPTNITIQRLLETRNQLQNRRNVPANDRSRGASSNPNDFPRPVPSAPPTNFDPDVFSARAGNRDQRPRPTAESNGQQASHRHSQIGPLSVRRGPSLRTDNISIDGTENRQQVRDNSEMRNDCYHSFVETFVTILKIAGKCGDKVGITSDIIFKKECIGMVGYLLCCTSSSYRPTLGLFLFYAFLSIVVMLRFSIGIAMEATSECSLERSVARYMIVKTGVSSVLFWIIVLIFNKSINTASNNKVYQAYISVDFLFNFIWQSLGIYWLLAKYTNIVDECPNYDSEWSFHLINVSVFIMSMDLLLWLYLIICVIYYRCCGDFE